MDPADSRLVGMVSDCGGRRSELAWAASGAQAAAGINSNKARGGLIRSMLPLDYHRAWIWRGADESGGVAQSCMCAEKKGSRRRLPFGDPRSEGWRGWWSFTILPCSGLFSGPPGGALAHGALGRSSSLPELLRHRAARFRQPARFCQWREPAGMSRRFRPTRRRAGS